MLTQRFSKKNAENNRNNIVKLEKKLNDLDCKINNGDNSYNIQKEYVETKASIEAHYRHLCKGASIRSKVKWFEEGERNTKYFLNLEKHHGVKITHDMS